MKKDKQPVWEQIVRNFSRVAHYIFYGYFAIRRLVSLIKELFRKGE